MIRERLAEVIQRESDLTVCAEAEDRQRALELVESSRPDLAIVDLTLKNSHGLELIKDLRARHHPLQTNLLRLAEMPTIETRAAFLHRDRADTETQGCGAQA